MIFQKLLQIEENAGDLPSSGSKALLYNFDLMENFVDLH
jgi:hypothetical protein